MDSIPFCITPIRCFPISTHDGTPTSQQKYLGVIHSGVCPSLDRVRESDGHEHTQTHTQRERGRELPFQRHTIQTTNSYHQVTSLPFCDCSQTIPTRMLSTHYPHACQSINTEIYIGTSGCSSSSWWGTIRIPMLDSSMNTFSSLPSSATKQQEQPPIYQR